MSKLALVFAAGAILLVGGSLVDDAEEGAGQQTGHAQQAQPQRAAAAGEASECDPNYSGACLNPYAYDYDCEGGSGDGPEYTGLVTVVGEDHYGLDADFDGTGCEI